MTSSKVRELESVCDVITESQICLDSLFFETEVDLGSSYQIKVLTVAGNSDGNEKQSDAIFGRNFIRYDSCKWTVTDFYCPPSNGCL